MNTDNNLTIDGKLHELHVEVSGDNISNEDELNRTSEEITLDDLGEIEDQPEMTEAQMKKFRAFVNGKLNHFEEMGKRLNKRRNSNKMAKKSRKKNRNK